MFRFQFLYRYRRVIVIALILIGLGLTGSLLFVSTPVSTLSTADASEGVFIRSQAIYCDRVDVSFEVIVAFPTDTATVNIWQGGSVIASTSGPSTSDGIYNVSVPLNPPVPVGTVLSTEVVVDDGGGFTVTDTGASMPCYENAGGDDNGGENPPPSSDWDGYTDGRLNPDMAEYYTVYCREDYAHVYRSSPPPTVKISEISIRDMLDLDANGGHFLTDGITVERNGDQITLSGNNGNQAPESGLKTFSLEDCVARNGSEPDEEPPSNPPPSDPPPNNPPDDEEVPPGNIWDIIFEWILDFLSLWCGVDLVGFGAIVVGLPLIFRRRRPL